MLQYRQGIIDKKWKKWESKRRDAYEKFKFQEKRKQKRARKSSFDKKIPPHEYIKEEYERAQALELAPFTTDFLPLEYSKPLLKY